MLMAHLHQHAEQLYADLGALSEKGATEVGEPLAKVYNTLLSKARERLPEDAMIGTLTPVGKGMSPCVLRALTGQLRLVLGAL